MNEKTKKDYKELMLAFRKGSTLDEDLRNLLNVRKIDHKKLREEYLNIVNSELSLKGPGFEEIKAHYGNSWPNVVNYIYELGYVQGYYSDKT